MGLKVLSLTPAFGRFFGWMIGRLKETGVMSQTALLSRVLNGSLRRSAAPLWRSAALCGAQRPFGALSGPLGRSAALWSAQQLPFWDTPKMAMFSN